MAKNPTVYDVAQAAGVSIATVSFTFRRPEKVKPSTREAVMAAARELGYLPDGQARGLARRRTGSLGLYAYNYLLPTKTAAVQPKGQVPVLPEDDTAWRLFPLYVDEVQRGVELECWERDFALVLGGGATSMEGGTVTDIAGRVDGLAVFAQTVSPDILELIARRIPVVEISEPGSDDGLSHVSVDNRGGMRALTEHLVREHGLTEFVFVGETASHDVLERFSGFRAALRAAGLKVPSKAQTVPGDAETQAKTLRDRWLADGELPQAVVCSTDQQALAFIDAFLAAGIGVPEKVAVTGFDGIVAGRLSRPGLTTVRQPMELLGRAAVELLVMKLGDPAAEPIHRQLPVSLLLRDSCGCPSVAR